MDYSEDATLGEREPSLSYDDTLPYEDQLPEKTKLSSRIGTSKLYLLSETPGVGRVGRGKRKRDDEVEDVGEWVGDEDESMDGPINIRPNALLLTGPPIAHLPTARIFAYATHFDADPIGLEWVDDTTCVLVFAHAAACKAAQRRLQKSPTEAPDDSGSVTAKSIPVTLWPPEERISKSLGIGQGLKGTLRMRPAREGDVKRKGARKESEYYKTHGTEGARTTGDDEGHPRDVRKRRRPDDLDEEEKRRLLDAELDEFLSHDDDATPADDRAQPEPTERRRKHIEPERVYPPSPPQRSRGGGGGRSLLERTSVMRAHPEEVWAHDRDQDRVRVRGERPMRPLPRRRGGRDVTDERISTRSERPRKTQQELDDELDAFLNERDDGA